MIDRGRVGAPRGQPGGDAVRMDRMTVERLLEPRDKVAAGRTLGIAGLAAGVVTIAFELVAVATGRVGSSETTLAQALLLGVALIGAGLVFWSVPQRMPRLSWVGIAVFGVLVVLWVGLGTRDASAAGQIGVVYPAVYAGAHLRPVVAWAVSSLAVLANGVVVVNLLPLNLALADLFVVGAAVVMLTLVLVETGRHQDALTARLADLATTDPLTGLGTRRVLEDAIAQAVLERRAPAHGAAAGAGLLLVDLDRFGVLNELYGHPVGDAALVHVGALVAGAVPAGATVARIGGDEIAVLLPDSTREQVRAAAGAVLDTVLASPLPGEHGGIPMSVSIGMTHRGCGAPDFADLYAAADAALYRAKAEGRGRVVVS